MCVISLTSLVNSKNCAASAKIRRRSFSGMDENKTAFSLLFVSPTLPRRSNGHAAICSCAQPRIQADMKARISHLQIRTDVHETVQERVHMVMLPHMTQHRDAPTIALPLILYDALRCTSMGVGLPFEDAGATYLGLLFACWQSYLTTITVATISCGLFQNDLLPRTNHVSKSNLAHRYLIAKGGWKWCPWLPRKVRQPPAVPPFVWRLTFGEVSPSRVAPRAR